MKKRKIRIHASCYAAAFYFILSGGTERFLAALALVFAHECGHIICALIMGLKLEEILIMPIGQRALIKGIYNIGTAKRIGVYMAGPMVSLITGLIIIRFLPNYTDLGRLSLSIGVFNILPFLPLDGGNVLMTVLGGLTGDIYAAKIILRLSKAVSKTAILFGFIWVILYPYNMDLLITGLFLNMVNERASAGIYNGMLLSLIKNEKKLKAVKFIYADKRTLLKDIAERMNTGRYNIVVENNNGEIKYISQEEVCRRLIEEAGE